MMSTRTSEALTEAESLMCEWADTARGFAERLGFPNSSPISRMIEQQRVFERRGGVKRRKPTRPKFVMVEAGSTKECECGRIFIGEQCPRCSGAERVTGRETRSVRPPTEAMVSANAFMIEAIVNDAPGWMQKVLKRRYLFKQPDSAAAQDMRMSKARYRQEINASLEYVAERVAVRRGRE